MEIRRILESYAKGEMTLRDAENALRTDHLESIGDHTVFDMSREVRKNIPEVIYAMSKDPGTLAEIAATVSSKGRRALISRASKEHYDAVLKKVKTAEYNEKAGTIVIGGMPEKDGGIVGIISAGTSDIKVAEEVRVMAEFMGCRTIRFSDVGVAAIHRILDPMKTMISENADCIVVVAGMEGALPTVITSLASVPVIGVPTSTGYGMGGKGEAALLGMLQTCSLGLAVVNIDNGIGAGAMAAMIANGRKDRTEK